VSQGQSMKMGSQVALHYDYQRRWRPAVLCYQFGMESAIGTVQQYSVGGLPFSGPCLGEWNYVRSRPTMHTFDYCIPPQTF
jgi:hypothetical protein